MDGIAEINSFPNLVGYPYSWFWRGSSSGMGAMFGDRIISESGFDRIAGGDNRQLPVRHIRWFDIGGWLYKWFPEPAPVRAASPVAQLDIPEVGDRVRASRGKPVFLAIYTLRKDFLATTFPAIVALEHQYDTARVSFVVCSVDNDPSMVFRLFERHDTAIQACWVRPWPSGQFDETVTPLGIDPGSGASWTPPLVAVFDRDGAVLAQGMDAIDLAPFARALEQTMQQQPLTLGPGGAN
jgi:hypothetical protein